MLQKKAPTVVRSGGVPSSHRGKGAARSYSNGEILPKKASGGVSVPATDPGKVPVDTGSIGEMPPMKTMTSSGGSPSQTRVGKAKTGLRREKVELEPGVPSRIGPCAPGIKGVGTSTALPDAGEHKPTKIKRADMALNGGTMLLKPSTKAKSVGSGGQTVHKCRAMETGSLASMDNHNARTTAAKNCEESVANYRTMKGKTSRASIGKMSQKLCSKDKADTGLNGVMLLQNQSSKVEADVGLSGEMLHENPATKEALDVQEQARLLIQELDELHMGESISFKEFNSYIGQLAPNPPWIDRNVKLEDEELHHQQDCLHGLYRFRYYKYKLSQQVSKKELHGDKLKEDYPEEDGSTWKEEFLQDSCEEGCSLEFLEKYGFFERFEKDGTLDWFFHPDYIYCASLDDYQRLVLLNYGGYEYASWADYHKYLQTYKMELEYLKYYEKLSKDLKWIENYRHTEQSSHKWGIICSRGAYQAIKIAATDFTEISATFAYIGYHVGSLTYI
ncbi:uncharacterized protein LOC100832214 [Brachypodium distachyon]|uniref:Uncharacterized protein n=1 Tax=Brachypodium distachyon TaxID=15368 RepID=I1H934_BRADI|nr:uncharacterized protein LOC100832214 [Brachypodium distachyon]KQK23345.1 hypothetical protein BRADI_1g72820v3 [Brachypodium distachyon]|eukprot:XP_003562000.1 uncharacterized protein LOC100832214 [Brachypodium distachyon]